MVGLDLNNIDSTNFAVNLTGRVLQYGLVGAGSELRLDFVAGTNQRLAAELVKPFGSTPIFVAPRLYFDRRGRNLYLDDVFVAEYREKQFGAGIDIGSDFGRDAEVRLGYDISDYTGRRRVGSPDLPEVDGTEAVRAPDLRRGHADQPARADARVPPPLATCASFSRRRQPTGRSTGSSSTARSRSPAAKCGRPGSSASGAATTACSSSAKAGRLSGLTPS